MSIDLHAHTTASDGLLGPEALVARARFAGVKVLAITDHDTVAGIDAAVRAARAMGGIDVVPGIEVSSELEGRGIHVLGHFVRPEDQALRDFTAAQEKERRARMERMVEKLRALGIAVDMTHVEAAAGSDNLCRPHLARALVDLGVCADMQDAFTRFLGDGAPAFSAHRRPIAADAIAMIHAAGGTATLAHPVVDGMERRHVEALRDMGLDGLEVFRADQVSRTRDELMTTALSLKLVPTGGSDFHREGDALGKVTLAERHFEALRARARA